MMQVYGSGGFFWIIKNQQDPGMMFFRVHSRQTDELITHIEVN
jgi:hypothetical protein